MATFSLTPDLYWADLGDLSPTWQVRVAGVNPRLRLLSALGWALSRCLSSCKPSWRRYDVMNNEPACLHLVIRRIISSPQLDCAERTDFIVFKGHGPTDHMEMQVNKNLTGSRKPEYCEENTRFSLPTHRSTDMSSMFAFLTRTLGNFFLTKHFPINLWYRPRYFILKENHKCTY